VIGSDKVGGTAVYRSNGEKVGKIQRVMIGKQSGKVGYAVMSFGGFMGIGEDFYPLPLDHLRKPRPHETHAQERSRDRRERSDVPHSARPMSLFRIGQSQAEDRP
jgi:hypothetical protein